eukprot:2055745-Prymnesium_polylepis.1
MVHRYTNGGKTHCSKTSQSQCWAKRNISNTNKDETNNFVRQCDRTAAAYVKHLHENESVTPTDFFSAVSRRRDSFNLVATTQH